MYRTIPCLAASLALLAGCAAQTPAIVGKSPHLILSGNDGKFPNVEGVYKVADPPLGDTLTVLDATSFPPRKIAEIEIQHTVTAPPMTIAITPDEKLALVSAPNRVDPADKTKIVTDNYMQIVDLEANPPRIIDRVQLGRHPLGVSVNRAGTLALAAHLDGNVSVLTIDGKSVKHTDTVKVGEAVTSLRMAGITPDGKWGFAIKRGTDTVALLAIDGNKVTYTKRDITAGNNPYGMEISSDGRFAAVANVGANDGSVGSVTLIDLTREPFRAVEHFTVGLSPEGIAISPDNEWIAISAQNGTNRPKGDPYRTENSRVELYQLKGWKATKVGEAFAGRNIQGIVFSPDGKHLVVQNYVEKELAFYRVTPRGPEDTGQRLPIPGYPAGLRTAVR
jgi:DNA-binding beta-propeller fold protein YncE